MENPTRDRRLAEAIPKQRDRIRIPAEGFRVLETLTRTLQFRKISTAVEWLVSEMDPFIRSILNDDIDAAELPVGLTKRRRQKANESTLVANDGHHLSDQGNERRIRICRETMDVLRALKVKLGMDFEGHVVDWLLKVLIFTHFQKQRNEEMFSKDLLNRSFEWLDETPLAEDAGCISPTHFVKGDSQTISTPPKNYSLHNFQTISSSFEGCSLQNTSAHLRIGASAAHANIPGRLPVDPSYVNTSGNLPANHFTSFLPNFCSYSPQISGHRFAPAGAENVCNSSEFVPYTQNVVGYPSNVVTGNSSEFPPSAQNVLGCSPSGIPCNGFEFLFPAHNVLDYSSNGVGCNSSEFLPSAKAVTESSSNAVAAESSQSMQTIMRYLLSDIQEASQIPGNKTLPGLVPPVIQQQKQTKTQQEIQIIPPSLGLTSGLQLQQQMERTCTPAFMDFLGLLQQQQQQTNTTLPALMASPGLQQQLQQQTQGIPQTLLAFPGLQH